MKLYYIALYTLNLRERDCHRVTSYARAVCYAMERPAGHRRVFELDRISGSRLSTSDDSPHGALLGTRTAYLNSDRTTQ